LPLTGVTFLKNSTNSNTILLDVKTSLKKWCYGNSNTQNVVIYNPMLNKDINTCFGVCWNDVCDPD
jgi:hypothetical protein